MALTSEARTSVPGAHALTDCLDRNAEMAADRYSITFVDYEASPDGLARSLTRAELNRRVTAVAQWLAARFGPGERVVIAAPQGIEYVVGFLGAIRAGLIAVPLFAPGARGSADGFGNILADCTPCCVLTTSAVIDHLPLGVRSVAVDDLPHAPDAGHRLPAPHPDDIAYLQYTSGSTRTPSGVVLTHANVLANAEQAGAAYGAADPDAVSVSWLPLFHDMGLMLALVVPLVAGIPAVMMDPLAFLQRPYRWLHLMSSNPCAISAAPNFAYDYCAARIDERDRARLRLDDVITLINGSEPVRPASIDRFNRAFADCGLRPETHRSSYGLAEATVFVSVTEADKAPGAVAFDRAALGAGTARPAGGGPVSTLVSCGTPVGQHVAVVDPAERTVLPDGAVGEIWVHGPNTGQGYWGRDAETSGRVFHAALDGATGGLPGSGWLRTGDLGFRHDGELFVAGRLKDLIIVDGRNHYPQDVEETVENAHPAIRRHHTAALSVPGDDGERLVVVAEYAPRSDPGDRDPEALTGVLRHEISARHGLALHRLVLVEPGSVPRTTSGKVARQACRARYLDGTWGDLVAGHG
ncbi:fatty acyl-AMP ligase [Saccharopolyspora taberi]|uniref:Fatty acyl-AMP ligase n=1 Tax=Saccharopolyspora taberi TaxID=60895 RepID=A0ABN3VBZ1_9PSEU